MLNPHYKRYADRLRQLIEEGQAVVKLERSPSGGTPHIQNNDAIPLQAWLAKVDNIIEAVFGHDSSHVRHLKELMPHGVRGVSSSYHVYPIIGLLTGALDDLENGYLLGQEFLIAADIFDTVLEQAKRLLESSYKDPAAILGRVVLEDALKRLARREGIDDSQRASTLNHELKKIGKYTQPQWRFVQAWLDIGNAAAHGKFGEYSKEDVERLLEGIAGFVAGTFHL